MVFAFILWTLTGGIYENSQFKTPPTEEQPDGGVAYSNTGAGYAQIAFVWLFGIFYDIGFSGLLVAYALEVLPFHLRAKGMMIMNITVQAILAIGKYVISQSPNDGNSVTNKKQPNQQACVEQHAQSLELYAFLHPLGLL